MNLLKLVAVFITIGLTSGCGTARYVWTEYPVSQSQEGQNLQSIDMKGAVKIAAVQIDNSDIDVAPGSGTFITSKATLSRIVAFQLESELRAMGGEDGGEKSIGIFIDYIAVKPRNLMVAGFLNGEARLGNGQVVNIETINNTPFGGVHRALDGAVATTVARLLKNSKVRQYLEN